MRQVASSLPTPFPPPADLRRRVIPGTRSKSASSTGGTCFGERGAGKESPMPGTVLQAHHIAVLKFDEVRVPNAAAPWPDGRRVDLEFTGEVYGFPAAILAAEEEAQWRPGVRFPACIVNLVQQP